MPGELNLTAFLLATFGILLAVSVVFSKALDRLGVPIVLLFLVLGMLAGSEGRDRSKQSRERLTLRPRRPRGIRDQTALVT